MNCVNDMGCQLTNVKFGIKSHAQVNIRIAPLGMGIIFPFQSQGLWSVSSHG